MFLVPLRGICAVGGGCRGRTYKAWSEAVTLLKGAISLSHVRPRGLSLSGCVWPLLGGEHDLRVPAV